MNDTIGQDPQKPVVLITGASGNLGSALTQRLAETYRVIGLDREEGEDVFAFDITEEETVRSALEKVRAQHGDHLAAVIHLAAYFDFSGEENPLYEQVNEKGTRHLLQALQGFRVDRFIYSGTMLLHRPSAPGIPITEDTPIEPGWAYPASKARTEEVIRAEHGGIPYALLHLAGLYDEQTAVPTLAEQIRRIYERDPKSHAYSGDLSTGQAFLHRADMLEAFARTVDRRADLPEEVTILIGEREAMGYDALQRRIAQLIHGTEDWETLSVPKPIAAAGAWAQVKAEPVVPDDFDQGEEPFIKPFMIRMADDHYELDISRAEELLGWRPKHSLRETLPAMIANMKQDPAGWYEANGLTKPHWLQAAEGRDDPEALRTRAEEAFRTAHARNIWAHFLNIGLGAWMMTAPVILGYTQLTGLLVSDMAAGLLVMIGSFLALSWRAALVRWGVAAVAVWIMTAPLLFWTESAAAYLNGTLAGAVIFALAVCVRPAPGVGTMAATTGPTIPPGWDYSPSDWTQRMPVIALAFIGLFVSRYLAAYQMDHVGGVWEPFFAGAPDNPKNGTEEIITSDISEAWPVPDAGLGALTYLLEILIGFVGSARRWRTMPWLVLIFGIMIVPLGVVSITFIIIQPILLGTWCTLCLITAAAMLIQIPYAVDELIATCQFLGRRKRAGAPVLRVLLTGDTDDGPDDRRDESFERPVGTVLRDMLGGGVNVTWGLAASAAIGLWLMFTRLTLGTEGTLANTDHLIGALALTIAVSAMAESIRAARFLNVCLGAALVICALVMEASWLQSGADIVAGVALMLVSLPRGPVRHSYGGWSRVVV
ncbi:vitamin K epoxide reductase family protein [Thalassorhabdomicrobium marinisediminis]|uniref:DNA polymerase III subunit epsilon n=1 Tax=Thalassorhabdomicrobium marinisediminis TaxID=2170577 RepID=A0A2T7G192_9RHOB|nr:vitamin K epoxide reductase family protein [Thalassorhabdomicrobium marinisediminis]PVA08158.1 DNA polymerase III subunit epsilon [Thalassorhabdomicrobium marinisediminis]